MKFFNKRRLSNTATITARVNRTAVGTENDIDILTIELYVRPDGHVETLVAYGHTAHTLFGFLIAGNTYVIDYEKWIRAEFDGEALGARAVIDER